MTRCEEFYEKVERDGNFCGMREDHYGELVAYIELLRKYPHMRGITERAGKPLIHEKDPEVKAKAIEAIGKNISHGNVPTAKQVQQLLENKRAGVKPGGRVQNNRSSTRVVDPIQSPAVILPPGENDEPSDEPEDLDVEKDYYTGDTPEIPETPDTQEPETPPKAIIVVPPDVADIEARMDEERIAREAQELQRKKNEEKDQREMDVIQEKNENTRTRDELAEEIALAMKKALAKGIPTVYISDAIDMAFDNVFPGWKESQEDTESGVPGATKSGGLFK
jgi:hypothetical protein